MSATDELRRMLDERGVDWKAPNDATRYIKTTWRVGPWEYEAVETSGGEFSIYVEHRYWLTTAQAVEATLGQGGMEWDGDVLVLTLPRDPSSIHVQRADGEPRKVYPSEATLGRGTCHDVCNSVAEFTCSQCGFSCDLTSWVSLFDGDERRLRHHHHGTPNFCPNCGREVER